MMWQGAGTDEIREHNWVLEKEEVQGLKGSAESKEMSGRMSSEVAMGKAHSL